MRMEEYSCKYTENRVDYVLGWRNTLVSTVSTVLTMYEDGGVLL